MQDEKILTKMFSEPEVQSVLKEMGVEALPHEEKAQLLSELSEVIVLHLAKAVLEKLPEEKREAFESLVGGGDLVALNALVDPHIPNFDAFVQNESRKAFALILARSKR